MSEYISALFEAVEMVLGTPLPTLARQEVTPEEALKFLSDTLITLPAYSDDLLFAVDSVNNLCPARHEMSLANLTSSLSINLSTDKIKNAKAVVWQGDITTLQVDAILNAANEKGLGCFEPSHRCIDNVIHRAAGPRLRVECNQLMRARGAQLVAGSVPIISKGYNLPSKFVIHATGPQLFRGESLTKEHEQLLSSTYRNVLDLAHSHKLKSLALCCISTGLFGYPSKEASVTALQTVKQWFDEHVDTTLEIVVFNVFSDKDFHAYEGALSMSTPGPLATDDCIKKASNHILSATNVIVCAGAGMSAKHKNSMENVYVDRNHFAHHYPFLIKYGYNTCYDAMGILGDLAVPEPVKWTYFIKHYNNLQNNFVPNRGYEVLSQLVCSKKGNFVVTSNVDSNFEQQGFKEVYTPQGSCKYYQCLRRCTEGSVWPTSALFSELNLIIDSNGVLEEAQIPKCKYCGGGCFINLRGGGWFLHHEEYNGKNVAFKNYVEDVVAKSVSDGEKLAVIEIGAGFNTPSVTRYLVEGIVREAKEKGGDVALIRINPTEATIPDDLKDVGVSLSEGWEVLEKFSKDSVFEGNFDFEDVGGGDVVSLDWRRMLDALRGN